MPNELIEAERDIDIEGVMVNHKASQIIDKLWSLQCLDLPKIWEFEADDSVEAYATLESLLDYLDLFGGKLIQLQMSDIKLIHKQNIESGRYLIQLD